MAGEEGGSGGAEGAQTAETGTDGQDPAELLAEMAGDGSGPEEGNPEDALVKAKAEAEKWKNLSRKNEQRARQNASAATKLAELEQAQMTEQQRAEARAAAAEQRAATAERLHWRTLAAAQHDLDPDLIDFLRGDTEEEISAAAETLARVINERVAKALPAQQAPAGNGISQMRRPVEALRPGGSPAGSAGSTDRNEMFRQAVLGATRR